MADLLKDTYETHEANKLVVPEGDVIALAVIRAEDGRIGVIAAEEVFLDVDDDSIEKILGCIRDAIDAARCAALKTMPVN